MIVPQRIQNRDHTAIRTVMKLPADVWPGRKEVRRYGFARRMTHVIQGIVSRHTDSFT